MSNSWPVKVRVVVRGAAVVGGVVAGGEVCRVRGGGPLVGGVVLVDGGGAELGGVVCVTGALACAAAAEVAGVVLNVASATRPIAEMMRAGTARRIYSSNRSKWIWWWGTPMRRRRPHNALTKAGGPQT